MDRRTFLRYAGRTAGSVIAPPSLLPASLLPASWRSIGAQTGGATPAFIEMRSDRTGITWVHENAMSPQRYLPETCGAGCAIFDFDNDGWMDLYFVNSGPADFFTPKTPLRNALYKNNRDGTFTDVTEKAGVRAAARSAWASRSATTTTTAIPICSSPRMAAARCITTTATARSPT